MLPPHRGSTPGLFRGVKEQAESKSQDRRCAMGRDKKQKMSHHETTCPALPQRPLAPAPWPNSKAKLTAGICYHGDRLGWGLASDGRRFSH